MVLRITWMKLKFYSLATHPFTLRMLLSKVTRLRLLSLWKRYKQQPHLVAFTVHVGVSFVATFVSRGEGRLEEFDRVPCRGRTVQYMYLHVCNKRRKFRKLTTQSRQYSITFSFYTLYVITAGSRFRSVVWSEWFVKVQFLIGFWREPVSVLFLWVSSKKFDNYSN